MRHWVLGIKKFAMRILFVSRAFPPVTGGIENQNQAVSVWLPKHASVTTITNPHGKKFLPFFLPYVTLRILFTINRYDVILFGDGVLSIVGWIVKRFFPRKTIVSIIHGLDLTYSNAFYQRYWVRTFMLALDGFIAVSRETKLHAVRQGIPKDDIVVIPNGIETESLTCSADRAALQKALGVDITDRKVILTHGRLAKRKGVEWFIRNVLVKLPENILYVVSGSGPEESDIRSAIEENGMTKRTLLLGRISDETRKVLLNSVDLFVQPNIVVPGDMEGFGIAVIEASICGRPVIASNLEGLKDAVSDGNNGILVEPGNAEGFRVAIIDLLENDGKRQALGDRARTYTQEHFHWNTISLEYATTLQSFVKRP